jgi:hypothetical protein
VVLVEPVARVSPGVGGMAGRAHDLLPSGGGVALHLDRTQVPGREGCSTAFRVGCLLLR